MVARRRSHRIAAIAARFGDGRDQLGAADFAQIDTDVIHTLTGPFFVEGAEPGDTLALHIADLVPARDWGAHRTPR
jgi:acetamidase/formamidase